MTKKLVIMFISIFLLLGVFSPVFSQNVNDLEDQIDQKNSEISSKQTELDRIAKEIAAIQSSSASTEEKLKIIKREMANVTKYINEVNTSINTRKTALALKEKLLTEKEKQLQQISVSMYKMMRVGIIDYFFSNSPDASLRDVLFKRFLINKQLLVLKNNKQEYAEINSEKEKLDKEEDQLGSQLEQFKVMKNGLVAQQNELNNQIYAKNTQTSSIKKKITLLKNQISDLQVAILLAKSGSANTTIDDISVACGSNSVCRNASLEGFNASAPSGYFAVFSFGAYTHRNGMSQYGALARAEAGQTYIKILHDYYNKAPVHRGTSGNILVATVDRGNESMNFETKYLWGIAEMPSDWPVEALKVQAIAARTYAYYYYYNQKNNINEKPICATESCQVWSRAKYDNVKHGLAPNWKTAIEQTEGMILSGISTQYSAVTGGYLNTSGWDTTDGSGNINNAWEKKTGIPWFYKAWYTKGYANDSSQTCNRKPWMSEEEMADLLNTYLVMKGIDVKGPYYSYRILPITFNSCNFGSGGNPYSMAQIKNLVNNPVTSISGNPVVTQNSHGYTSSVGFITNRGAINISGEDFKQVFNMRAPGYLLIPQNGFVFINVIRK
ncbi:hypothetical protein M0R04_02835 [Candidatus Dojkabacteria bacterium]|jgi:peptidoglycan hydrolase-like amidase|nr:hypothetical protein [Candidatus Dojkabacteria bacterium]